METLTSEDRAKVSAAVSAAELTTSGEIVPVITELSDSYGDIALAWAALAAFTVLTLCALFPAIALTPLSALYGAWNAGWTPGEVFTIASGTGIIVFLATWLAQLWLPLRIALVPGSIKTERAENRAIALFKVGADRRTHGRTGVLIYLSMREHRAEIVADEAITSKVAPEIWGEAMADMLAEIRDGRLGDGLVAGIRDVGLVLSEHFPRDADDQNELPDRLIEL